MPRLAFGLAMLLVAAAAGADQMPALRFVDFAPVPIGSTLAGLDLFRETDCSLTKEPFGDCGAVDRQGRRYTFFDGGLSRVDLSRDSFRGSALPLGLAFGIDMETAAETLEAVVGVELERGTDQEGRTVYTSDFAVPSSIGVMTSVELIADSGGKLAMIVQRIDF